MVKIDELNAINKINEICKIKGYKFIDFKNKIWVNSRTKLLLECPIHGKWETSSYNNFIHKEYGCPKCGVNRSNTKKTINQKIAYDKCYKKAEELGFIFHGFVNNKYLKAINTYLILECPIHGKWETTSYNCFINSNQECPKCAGKNIEKHILEEKCEKIANKKNYTFYGFVDNKYVGVFDTYLILECPIHGKWETTNYNNFVHNKNGCPNCKKSKIEENVKELLNQKKIQFIHGKYGLFNWLINPKTNRKLQLDFYLPEYNIAIECQGSQHFLKSGYFGGDKKLIYTKQLDNIKKTLCEKNNLSLYYINYNDNIEKKLNTILDAYF